MKIENIRILSVPDIIAMKLNAISVSGQRSKDFIDIYFCLRIYGIAEMIDFYKRKYTQISGTHILKSLIWFDDVDLSDWPVLVSQPKLTWAEVKSAIEKQVLKYMKDYIEGGFRED